MCLCIHNTAVKTTVVPVEIVGMHPWSCVLLLLLLLKGFVANVTCVMKWATCVRIAQR